MCSIKFMPDCIFCNIANKTLQASILFEDEFLLVIKDILPKAPVHLLVMPKKHIAGVNTLENQDEELAGKIIFAAKAMAEKHGISQSGYKLVFNVGSDVGQIIPHLHLHLLEGKKLAE